MDLNVLSTHPAGPKYSMAPLIGKRSGSDEVGPGKYDEVKAEQDKYSKPPCWSIGNPAKDGLWGADSKEADKLETPEIDESGVPGPGQYSPVEQSPYSPKFGFGSRRKDPKPGTCPGPGQYELKSTLQGRGKGKDGKSTEPGPGEFSPNSSITSRSAPAIGFSASNRDKASVSDSPGPGQYDLATTLTGGAWQKETPQ
ncbi:hypothetical protein AK812_SmicGene21207 [Symbiodinium microadriaticum]|uniref:Outer dense fiber protein 3 n=1 Tax=Symbiodinium microadriaticum TaxID=2951 RepID=A0A1Q9DMZ1_SYMMI|nr:hypothetical protein AK812_SmicGene21207 [Symbiodinium microadriaticum]